MKRKRIKGFRAMKGAASVARYVEVKKRWAWIRSTRFKK